VSILTRIVLGYVSNFEDSKLFL